MTGTERLEETELQPLINHNEAGNEGRSVGAGASLDNCASGNRGENAGISRLRVQESGDVTDGGNSHTVEFDEIAMDTPSSDVIVRLPLKPELLPEAQPEAEQRESDETDYEASENEPSFSWINPAVTEKFTEASPMTDLPPTRFCLPRTNQFEKKFEKLFHSINYHESEKLDKMLNDEEQGNLAVLLTKRDESGLTCLMKAIARQSLGCLPLLLKHLKKIDFDSYKINKIDAFQSGNGTNIFHFAAQMVRDKEVINEIDDEIDVDLADQLVNSKNECGATPLIIACQYQNHLMAQRLVNYKAKIDLVDKNGCSPIYWAVVSGSYETLKLFLVHGERDARDQLQLFKNHSLYKGKGTILQAIVESRCEKTLQVCLEIDDGKENIVECLREELDSNDRMFIHSVCETSLVKLVELAIEDTEMILKRQDDNDVTPLMKATEARQLDIIKLILSTNTGKQTLPLSRKDTKETSLIIACQRGYDEIIEFIMENAGQDMDLGQIDVHRRNAFHYAAKHDGLLSVMIKICIRTEKYKNYQEYLQQRDIDNFVALHLAAASGAHNNVEWLLANEIPYDTPSCRTGRTALHYAACSNLDTVKALVKYVEMNYGADKKRQFIDSADSWLQTSLHIAASLGKFQTVSFLLDNGAAIKSDKEKETPLHLAAYTGCIRTVQLLLQSDPTIVNHENRVGETAAVFAAVNGQTEMINMLLSQCGELWVQSEKESVDKRKTCLDGAVMNRKVETAEAILEHKDWKKTMEKSCFGPDGLLAEMVKKMPNVAVKVLNKCQMCEEETPKTTKYDFFALQTVEEVKSCGRRVPAVTSMKALETMAELKMDECLSHAVVQKFLDQKWSLRAKKWYMGCFIIYLLFLAFFTLYISLVVENCSENLRVVASVVCWIFAILNIIKELFQLFHRKLQYFCCMSSYLELVQYISVFIFLPYHDKSNLQRQAGAIAIFLAWINFTGFLKRSQTLGVYIIMAKKIFMTFLKVFIPISFFIIAFSMTFFVLLHDKDTAAFGNVVRAFVTSFAMMVGEVDYRDSFLQQTGNNFVLLMFVLTLFLIIMGILLMNLLTGLAVGDIGVIMKRSLVEKRILQAKLIVEMDKYLTKYPGLKAGIVRPLYVQQGREPANCLEGLKNILFPPLDIEEEKSEKQEFEAYSRLQEQIRTIQNTLDEIKRSLPKEKNHPSEVQSTQSALKNLSNRRSTIN